MLTIWRIRARNVIVESRTSADAIARGGCKLWGVSCSPQTARRLRLLPIKLERSTLTVRAIQVSDCKIRSIPFDWPIRCNVRWKSLLPRQNRSLPIFVVPRAMLGETRYRDSMRSRWQMGSGLREMSGDSVAWSQLCSRAYLWCLRLISVLWDTNYFCWFPYQPIYVWHSEISGLWNVRFYQFNCYLSIIIRMLITFIALSKLMLKNFVLLAWNMIL